MDKQKDTLAHLYDMSHRERRAYIKKENTEEVLFDLLDALLVLAAESGHFSPAMKAETEYKGK